jgi:O-acetyl-ADP-ribose deacetylase (regulator of RNase III)
MILASVVIVNGGMTSRHRLTYVEGDATACTGGGEVTVKVLVHICNDIGMWGKGFVLAVSKRWPGPEREYRAAFAQPRRPALGDVQFVKVGDGLYVANLIGQHGISRKAAEGEGSAGQPPIRYDAVRKGLKRVAAFARSIDAESDRAVSIHMPRIGCGLAGGLWSEIEPIIHETLSDFSIVVYDPPSRRVN